MHILPVIIIVTVKESAYLKRVVIAILPLTEDTEFCRFVDDIPTDTTVGANHSGLHNLVRKHAVELLNYAHFSDLLLHLFQ